MRRITVALVLIGFGLGWLIAGMLLRSTDLEGRTSYPTSIGDAGWIGSPEGGNHIWLRAEVLVPEWTQSASMLIDTTDQIRVYVDGNVISRGSAVVLNTPASSGGDALADSYDLTTRLTPGVHAIGIDLASLTNATPRLRAVIQLTGESRSTQFLTSTSGLWRTTSDIALLNIIGTPAGILSNGVRTEFAVAGFPDSRWSQPTAMAPPTASSARSAVPLPALATPLPTTGLLASAQDVIVRTQVDLPNKVHWMWLRAWTNGVDYVTVDGTGVTSSPIGRASPTSASVPASAVYLLDISNRAHRGRLTIDFHITDAGYQSALLADLVVAAGTTVDAFPLVSGDVRVMSPWRNIVPAVQIAQDSLPDASNLSLVNLPATQYASPTVASTPLRLILAVEICAAAVLAGCALRGWPARDEMTPALRNACLSLGPAAVFAIILSQLGSWIDIAPPAPYEAQTGLAMIAILIAGVGAVRAATSTDRAEQFVSTSRRLPAGSHRRTSSIRDGHVGRVGRAWWRHIRAHPLQWGSGAIAAIGFSILSYDLGYEAYWQDELYSIGAAQGMRGHLLPEWPSGFLYFKSELYTAVIAVVGGAFGDGPVPLRLISVLFYAATVFVVGTWLLPQFLSVSPLISLIFAAAFAIAPVEVSEARDVRMYQMVQLATVVFFLSLIRAARHPTSGRIWLSAILMLAMYLTHEESFCVLPAVPIILIAEMRMRWLRERRWLIPYGAVSLVVLLQLAAARFTHPPSFGVDASATPFLRWQPDVYFYVNYLFSTAPTHSPLMPVTLLATLGAIMGIARRDRRRLYLLLLVSTPLLTLSLVLPAKEPRYVFLILPFLFALAFGGILDIAALVAALGRHASWRTTTSIARVSTALGLSLFLVIGLSNGFGNYGLAVGQLTGDEVPRANADFDVAGDALASEVGQNDILISAAPDNLVAEYFHRVPDYWLAHREGQRMLYLIEKDGKAVDTEYGKPVLLDGPDLQHVLDTGRRVWIVTKGSDGYIGSLLPEERSIINTHFELVYEGQSVLVYRSLGGVSA